MTETVYENKEQKAEVEYIRIYGIASQRISFKTPNWRFNAGTSHSREDGVVYHHKASEVDTIGYNMGYDKGIHKFKIEYEDGRDNMGQNYCAFGVVSHYFFNNIKGDWISNHNKNYYFLTENGFLCKKDEDKEDFIDTSIKWVDEQNEYNKVIVIMELDLDKGKLSYMIGKRKIDGISIDYNQNMKYYPCVSGRKGNFNVKILG